MYHPSRGGVRGGRDQFNWDDVKGDKHRENYLGHSVKAPVGRWQKGKDLYWYTKDHGSEGPSKEEIKRIQEEEEDAMKEMLGLAPRKSKRPQGNQLDKREVDELLRKGKGGEQQDPAYVDGERVQGLGFAPAPGQTGGQSGVKRTVEVKENDYVSFKAEQISSRGHVKEVEKTGTQPVMPPSEDVATSVGIKENLKVQQDVCAVSFEDEAASRKKRKEEKRKAKELRREAKHAKREARKASKDDRSNERKLDPSRQGKHQDKGGRRHERKDTSPDFQSQRKGERYIGNDSDSNGEKAGRMSMGHNSRRKDDYDSSSEDEPFQSDLKYRRWESPGHRGQRTRREDVDRERKIENSSISSEDSEFVMRHKRKMKEDSPIRTSRKHRRHDSDSEGSVDSQTDRLRKQRREESPNSRDQRQRRYDSDSDEYVKRHRVDQRRKREERGLTRSWK